MTDYTKNTNFTAKDALTSGDPNKRILGSLFDSEFNEIAAVIATKADKTYVDAEVDAALGALGLETGTFPFTLRSHLPGGTTFSGTMSYVRSGRHVTWICTASSLCVTSAGGSNQYIYLVPTSLPASIVPTARQMGPTALSDSASYNLAQAEMSVTTGQLSIYRYEATTISGSSIDGVVSRWNTLSPPGWPASTSIGIVPGWTWSYVT